MSCLFFGSIGKCILSKQNAMQGGVPCAEEVVRSGEEKVK